MKSPVAAVSLVALLVVALLPGSAAAVVRVSSIPNEGIKIEAVGSAGVDRLKVLPDVSGGNPVIKVLELNDATMQVGPGCGITGGVSVNSVRCDKPVVAIVTATLGLGNDNLELTNGVGDCFCDGGDGNDRLTGAEGQDLLAGGGNADTLNGGEAGDTVRGEDGGDTISGGPGNDVVEGGAGNDSVNGSTGADQLRGGEGTDTVPAPLGDGADVFDGGPGTQDLVNYGSRSAAVTVTIGAVGADGTTFRDGPEGDDVRSGIEAVNGGSGNDSISGFFASIGSLAGVTLDGGAGNDQLKGSENGGDTLIGGIGSDDMRGFGGADRLMARDGIDDQVNVAFSCATGEIDVLDVDLKDDDTRPLTGNSCEQIDSGPVKELPNVRNLSGTLRRRDGKVTVRLRCPQATRNGCVGVLAAARNRARPRFMRATHYSIRRGRSATVTVVVPGGIRSVLLRSLERGRIDTRTTFWVLPVR